MWIVLAFISAICLGFYDVSKKIALRDNKVVDVLMLSTCISSLILAVPLVLSRIHPEWMLGTPFYVPRLDLTAHLYTLLKSVIVLSSWVFAYISLKHLPISVVSPVQATRPMWTLVGAMLIFGERLNLYLSFLPDDVKEISSTGFESYLVNDSNYYMQVSLMSAEGASWRLRFSGIIEPNSKLFVEAFDRSQVNDLERLCVQAIAWKQDKPFSLKPAITTELRLNLTKFYKLHVFHPNEFFNEPNWTEDVIRDDKPVRNVFVDAEQVKEAVLNS